MNIPVRVVWLKPTKKIISVGRNLIANNLEKNGYKIEILECSGLNVLKVVLHLLKSDFDVVVGTTHLGLAIGGIIKLLKGKPFVADFVDKFSLIIKKFPIYLHPFIYIIILLEKLSLRIADAIIVVPKDEYKNFIKKRDKVYKTNLCINLERIIDVDKRVINEAKEILKKAGVDLGKPIIVYVGGFSKVYNLEMLVEAMELLPEFQLVMIGGGELEGKLKDIKRTKKLDNVFFIGYQPNDLIPGFLKLSDIGVTLAEVPRQLKIYEYLAAGLNVIVPESILNDEDFEFAEYCIGVKLNKRDIVEKINNIDLYKKSIRYTKLKKDLNKYSCKKVSSIYGLVLKSVLSLMIHNETARNRMGWGHIQSFREN